jgi:ABC-2 type transport system ATP-binding protein
MEYLPGDYSVVVEHVSKTFNSGFFNKRHTRALNDVSLSVKRGEVFGLLGPNGAGKTTLLNILSTQLVPDAGTVTILGKRLGRTLGKEGLALRNRINMCSGNPNFPWSLTIREILKFYAMLYGLSGRRCKDAVDRSVALLELDDLTGKRYDTLSTGTKQKLALAKALLNDPELLFLDEPTIGLDPDIAKKIRDLVRDIHGRNGITILITTHYMREAEELCERLAFIRDGEIKVIGSPAELLSMMHAKDLEEVFLELAH